MAARQFLVPGNHATVRGLVLPGATASLYTTGTTTPQPFYSTSALSVSLGTTLTANGAGTFPVAYQDETIPFRLILKDKTGTELEGGDIDPFYFGQTLISVTGGNIVADTRTELAAIDGTAGSSAYLSESGREGMFVWSSASNTANVTRDPGQGVYVAPASDTTGASGAWVRKYTGPVYVDWFGAVGDVTTNDATAIQRALDFANTLGGGHVRLSGKTYRCSSQLTISTALHLEGSLQSQDATVGTFPSAYIGSTLYFDAATAGILVKYITASGSDATADIKGGSETIIEKLRLASAGAGATSAAKYGIDARSRVTIRDVEVRGFGDHGLYLRASLSGGDGVVFGNANRCVVENVRCVLNAGDGFYLSGSDSNVTKFDTCHAQDNEGYGFTDDCQIQSLWLNCTEEGNTTGGFRTIRSNIVSSFIGCETEDTTPARHSIGTYCTVRGGTLEQVTSMPEWQNYGGMKIYSGHNLDFNDSSNTVGIPVNNDGTNLWVQAPIKAVSPFKFSGTLQTVASDGTNIVLNAPLKITNVVFNGSGVLQAAAFPVLTGDVTTAGAALATTIANNAVAYAKFQQVAAVSLVGNATGSLANATGITLAGGLGFSGSTLTAAGALTPTSVASTGAVTSSSASAGIGYATGAGGTITQASSRTTGVTLDKVCGAITLVSAAGTATWQTFTVTNSTVAATDVIRVSQKSGTDLNMIHVTNVAAGSFKISFATTGGTTTEQPVFNFAVVKAVAA